MKATFVDLRKNSSRIILALKRKESVTVYYRGKVAAVMRPIGAENSSASSPTVDHPAFGLWADRTDLDNVDAHVRKIRKGRIGRLCAL